MKQLKDIGCYDMSCENCPLRIFGCAVHSKFYSFENEAEWSSSMTLGEVLQAKIDAVAGTVKNKPILKMVFDNAVACAKIALLNYIDEEELLSDD